MSKSIAVAGSGSIGVAFSVVFAQAGYEVRCWDVDPARLGLVSGEVRTRLEALSEHGLLDEQIETIAARVRPVADLAEACDGVALVQECAPERADVKSELFARLEQSAPTDAILASSSSAIPISKVTSELDTRGRTLVAHPGNPPYLIPVIELVPAAYTEADCLDRSAEIYRSAGLSPVRLNFEVEGFVFNRLQGAVMREAYCLVRDGVIDVEGLDTVMRQGPGLRWSFMGPFETVDLNTRGGIASHAVKMGPAYARMGAERGQDDPWTPELVSLVEGQRREQLPADEWEERVAWRDEQLMRLAAMRRAKD